MAGKIKGIKSKPSSSRSSTSSKARLSSRKSGGSGRSLGMVDEASRRADERRAAGNRRWVSIDDGESAQIRVIDAKEFKDLYVHRVPFAKRDGGEYHRDVPCLDQDDKGVPCPGCKDEIQRRYKFYLNVIVRDAEVLNDEGDPTGKTADQVMIWSGGITVARRLNKLHGRVGLESRDIVVEREGTKKKTKYDIDWATDENEPLSANDKKLAKNKHDLSRYTDVPEFDDFYKASDDDDEDEDSGSSRRGRTDPWADRRKRRSSRDDDDDSSRGSSRRSSSARSTLKRKGSSNSSSDKTTVRRRRPRT